MPLANSREKQQKKMWYLNVYAVDKEISKHIHDDENVF